MSWIDFTILYFSIGSAFAAHNIFTAQPVTSRRLKSGFKALLLWPVVAISIIAGFSLPSRLRFVFGERQKTVSLPAGYATAARELEKNLAPGHRSDELFRLRDTVARYAALTMANRFGSSPFDRNILGAISGEFTKTQAICLSRRNRMKVRRHRTIVRDEFVEVVIELISQSREPEIAGAAAINFAKLLNDAVAVKMLRDRIEDLLQTRRTISVPSLESSKWKAREHQPT